MTPEELVAASELLGLLLASVAVVGLVALLAGDLGDVVRGFSALLNGKGKA